jgi:hypothetical protein
MLITVDLASKFSAVMVRSTWGEVICQFDSSGMTAFEFVDKILAAVLKYKPELILVEDVPYGISSQAQTKPVTRLQGILILALRQHLDKVYFLNPSTWQKKYPGVGTAPRTIPKKDRDAYRIEAARAHAEGLGYTPPDLVAQYVASLPEGTRVLKKNTNPLAKSMTDYVDAFLMTDWAYGLGLKEVTKQTGVQPVFL